MLGENHLDDQDNWCTKSNNEIVPKETKYNQKFRVDENFQK